MCVYSSLFFILIFLARMMYVVHTAGAVELVSSSGFDAVRPIAMCNPSGMNHAVTDYRRARQKAADRGLVFLIFD
jgi:hypothetical protein